METGTLKVSKEIHTRFKVACVLRGITMQDAAAEALQTMMTFWSRGSGNLTSFIESAMLQEGDGAVDGGDWWLEISE